MSDLVHRFAQRLDLPLLLDRLPDGGDCSILALRSHQDPPFKRFKLRQDIALETVFEQLESSRRDAAVGLDIPQGYRLLPQYVRRPAVPRGRQREGWRRVPICA